MPTVAIVNPFGSRMHTQATNYTRTAEQDLLIGLQPSTEALQTGIVDATSSAKAMPRQVVGASALLAKAKANGDGVSAVAAVQCRGGVQCSWQEWSVVLVLRSESA